MKVILIAAHARNLVIGKNNELPWTLAADTQHFHHRVRGNWKLLGRKSYEARGERPPFGPYIVVTRQEDYVPADTDYRVPSIEEGILLAEVQRVGELYILGGAEIYRKCLPLADTLLLTEVDVEVGGDTFFPEYASSLFKEVSRKSYSADRENPYNYAFVEYERVYDRVPL